MSNKFFSSPKCSFLYFTFTLLVVIWEAFSTQAHYSRRIHNTRSQQWSLRRNICTHHIERPLPHYRVPVEAEEFAMCYSEHCTFHTNLLTP